MRVCAMNTSVNNRFDCDAARTAICAISESSNNNTDGTRQRFLAMCQACEDTLGYDDDECVAETIRAVSLVTVEGYVMPTRRLWTAQPKRDQGYRQVAVSNTETPMTDSAFFSLGQNIGGAGYYRSAPRLATEF